MTAPDLGPVIMDHGPGWGTPAQPMRRHPLADAFPEMPRAEYEQLLDDVKANGVREPIVMYDGQLLDGRHRYKAAVDANLPYPRRDYLGDDPIKFVISANMRRRHMDAGARSAIGAKLSKMQVGRPSKFASTDAISQTDAAQIVGVSRASIQRSVEVEQKDEVLFEMIARSEVSPTAAVEVVRLPEEERAEVVAAGPKAVRAKAKAIREERAVPLAALVADLPPEPEPEEAAASEPQGRDPVSVLFDIDALMHELPDDPHVAAAEVDERVVRAIDTANIRDSAAWLIGFADAVDAERGTW